jgi:hypothetical protein
MDEDRGFLPQEVLTNTTRAPGAIEATTDETEGTETGTETEIAVTEEIEGIVENVEGRDRHITARRAVKARSIPIPPAATTERENERTDTEATAEGMKETGNVTEATEARLEGMSAEILMRDLAETEIYSMIAEAQVVAAVEGETVTHSKLVAEAIAMLSRTERRVPVHPRKRRNQPLI